MRAFGFLVIILFLLGGCKTTTAPSASEVYKEDLTVLRPELGPTAIPEKTITSREDFRPMTGHLMNELDSINRIIVFNNKARRFVDGYTIQIYTGNDRETAQEAAKLAAIINPELNPQIHYYQPSYKVKVGQYTDRLEAHQVFESLKKDFPLALLIPERIKVDYDKND